MKKFFFAVVLALAAASLGLYWTRPESGTKVPILYWVTQNDPVKRETIRLFEKWLKDKGYPPAEIRIDASNQDPTKNLVQGVSGVGADILDVYTFQTELYASSGMLLDLTEDAKRMGFTPSMTFPALKSDIVINGRQYGFPRNVGSQLIWVNRNTFKKYRVPEPPFSWNWDQFEELGRTFVAAANPPGTHKRVYFVTAVSTQVLRRGLGLSVYNETMTRCILNDPRNTEVMRRIYHWTVDEHLIPTLDERMAMTAQGTSTNAMFSLYLADRYAMLYNARWALIYFRQQPQKLNVRIIEPFTSGFPNTELGGGMISIYRGTKHRESALRFVQFLTSKPFNLLIARAGDSMPPVPKYIHSKEFLRPPDHPDEWAMEKVFSEVAPKLGIAFCRSPYVLSNTYWRIDTDVTQAVLAGRLSPEEASRTEAQRINHEIQLTLQNDTMLQKKYARELKVQAKIDAYRAAGKPVPASWISNPFYLAYYRAKGWLEEDKKP